MKKIIVMLLVLLLYPINILAYSEYIIPGGENIGINLKTDGLVVVGFYKVNNEYIGNEFLKVGDIITEIEGIVPNSIADMSKIIEDNIINGEVNIKILRNNKEIETKLKLVFADNIYKTGLYVKDKISGIGTLTYIDPVTKIYGALGHEIVLSEANSKIDIKNGAIFESRVNGLERSNNGFVGSKNATILYKSNLGTINKNTQFGIYGLYNSELPLKDLVEVAEFDEIKLQKAYIYTTFANNSVEEFEIEITKTDSSLKNLSKSISFKITDKKLLEHSGGIVQGMSGSPIIQNNKIIGCVTHVVVEDVTKGYGIYIKTMLKEGEK